MCWATFGCKSITINDNKHNISKCFDCKTCKIIKTKLLFLKLDWWTEFSVFICVGQEETEEHGEIAEYKNELRIRLWTLKLLYCAV